MSQDSETTSTHSVGSERAAFIGRLQSILKHWPSADRLARATGVSPSAFRKWLRGEAEPSRERLVALANASGVPVGWLASGDGPEPRFQSAVTTARTRGIAVPLDARLDRQDYVILPKQPEAAAAGPESPPAPAITEFIAFRRDWVRSNLGIEPDQLTVETALGESMEPGILNGDLLLVDTTDTHVHSFGVYVVEIAGERLVKRVQPRLDGSLTLISDNPAYEAEHVPPGRISTVQIIGRVLWTCGPTRSGRWERG
jgi:phage repressor protein C with HTH and peptisase S24 domain